MFTRDFPSVVHPEVELARLINYDLPPKMRDYSKLYRIYGSTYKEEPKFVKRILHFNEDDSMTVLLPEDGSRIKMLLKDPNQTEPDFVLFIRISAIHNIQVTEDAGYWNRVANRAWDLRVVDLRGGVAILSPSNAFINE